MATEVWWIDPPRSYKAGGTLRYLEHDDSVDEAYIHNNWYHCGFQCMKQWMFPLDLISDHYECFSQHFFIKFKIPTTASGTFQSADLYLRIGNADLILNVNPIYMDMDVYYYDSAIPSLIHFPWQTLNENDYPLDYTGWNKNSASFENFYQMWADYMLNGPHWLDPVDVTSGVQSAIDKGLEWTALCMTPSHRTPLDWDWDERPTAYDQEVWLAFYGAVSPYWVEAPSGFSDTYCSSCPWLKLTYSGGNVQYVPGEDVTGAGQGSPLTCVAADSRANVAIVGTDSGSLWFAWSGGRMWDKVYEIDESITAVWMDPIRNFQDYPYDQVSYFGTVSGNLYKSKNSLGNFNLIKTFPSAVVEVMTSNLDSNKVAVGITDGIWTSVDGGATWLESLSAS